jgi:hypothetical protein
MKRNTMVRFVFALTACGVAACSGGQPEGAEVAAVAAQDAHGAAAADVAADTLVVYKSPTCGCCSNWVDHARENGFAVVTHDIDDPVALNAKKQELGVPAGRASCHTATVSGYTIEGHVPADLIRKLIAEQPRGVRGLAVPGMPVGSPGMEGMFKQEYDVLSFDGEGNVAVYARR